MHSCCWMLFLMVFIMKYGFSVNSAPVEKFLCDLNTWNGCNFPDQFGFYFMNTVSSLRKSPPLLFWGASEAQSSICNRLSAGGHIGNCGTELQLFPSALLFFVFQVSVCFLPPCFCVYQATLGGRELIMGRPVRQHALNGIYVFHLHKTRGYLHGHLTLSCSVGSPGVPWKSREPVWTYICDKVQDGDLFLDILL